MPGEAMWLWIRLKCTVIALGSGVVKGFTVSWTPTMKVIKGIWKRRRVTQ